MEKVKQKKIMEVEGGGLSICGNGTRTLFSLSRGLVSLGRGRLLKTREKREK